MLGIPVAAGPLASLGISPPLLAGGAPPAVPATEPVQTTEPTPTPTDDDNVWSKVAMVASGWRTVTLVEDE